MTSQRSRSPGHFFILGFDKMGPSCLLASLVTGSPGDVMMGIKLDLKWFSLLDAVLYTLLCQTGRMVKLTVFLPYEITGLIKLNHKNRSIINVNRIYHSCRL